jgi:hypothetical protein
MKLLDRIYCDCCGESEEYFIEKPHLDCKGEGLYADIVTLKCHFIVATFHSSKNKPLILPPQPRKTSRR